MPEPSRLTPVPTRGPSRGILTVAAFLASGLAVGEPSLSELDLRIGEAELAPTISIREAENRTTEEYRVNGHLYMVKITPVVGAPYYLVDQDGSGDMSLHRGGSALDNQIPSWVLLSW